MLEHETKFETWLEAEVSQILICSFIIQVV